MKDKLKKIKAHIFRGWAEGELPHPQLQIFPPFLFELIIYIIALSIVYDIAIFIYRLI